MTSELAKIYILEDDDRLQAIYTDCLSPNYDVTVFSEISFFCARMREIYQPTDALALLDLSLNEGFLWDYLDSSLLTVPFMIVSGMDDITILRDCYAKGAVDYLLKPLRLSELIVKIENFFSKKQRPSKGSTLLDHVSLDLSNMTLKTPLAEGVPLTPKEMRIIAILLKEPHSGVPKAMLFEHVWGSDRVKVNPKTLDIHMYNLRRKIRCAGLDINIGEFGHYKLSPCP